MLTRETFRKKDDVFKLKEAIKSLRAENINIMEVCGTHTMAIAEAGIKEMLPSNIRLISGPGCPVCVTPAERIDDFCRLSLNKDIIITTYGDMIRVPGTDIVSLETCRMQGADVRTVYSSMDALYIAKENPAKEVVFLGVGFETTAPATAAAIKEAEYENIDNFSVFSLHKMTPPAVRSLLESREIRIDGFLLPGHVSVITGEKGFGFLKEDYKTPGVISGFEPADILSSIYILVKDIINKKAEIRNEYIRAVKHEGNIIAMKAISEVFLPCDDYWRGLGFIKNSGLCIKDEYKKYDAIKKFDIKLTDETKKTSCRCGDVLKGLIEPYECPLFEIKCNPDTPIGPCMVSSEGSCAAAYKYR